MNTSIASLKTPLAILTAQSSDIAPVAVLSLELSTAADGWYHLLPAGHFKAKDGRPEDVPGGHWFLDAATAAAVIARNASLSNDRPVDYEHQTLNSEKNGQAAPAAGWFNASELQWRDDSGLWIKPRWTDRARDFIANKEYRFLSAVFPYDETSGQPLWIHSIALTNDPGLDGLHPLASLKAGSLNPTFTTQEKTMDPILVAILKALGFQIADETKPEDLPQQDQVLAALKAIQDKAATADVLAGQVAVLKANPPEAKPDPVKYAPVDVVIGLRAELAALKAQSGESEVNRLLDEARADGRLLPSEEEWLCDVGLTDLASLKRYLGTKPAIAALKGTQTSGKEQPGKTGAEGLTSEELEAAKLTGKSPQEYAALKASLTA